MYQTVYTDKYFWWKFSYENHIGYTTGAGTL